jgi:hypothetical protein
MMKFHLPPPRSGIQRRAYAQSMVAVAATFAFATLIATSLVLLLH